MRGLNGAFSLSKIEKAGLSKEEEENWYCTARDDYLFGVPLRERGEKPRRESSRYKTGE